MSLRAPLGRRVQPGQDSFTPVLLLSSALLLVRFAASASSLVVCFPAEPRDEETRRRDDAVLPGLTLAQLSFGRSAHTSAFQAVGVQSIVNLGPVDTAMVHVPFFKDGFLVRLSWSNSTRRRLRCGGPGSDAGSIAGGLYLRPGSWKVLPRIRAAPSIAVFWSQMFLGSAGESLPAWGHSPKCSDVPVDHCCLDSPHPLELLLFLLDLVLIGYRHVYHYSLLSTLSTTTMS